MLGRGRKPSVRPARGQKGLRSEVDKESMLCPRTSPVCVPLSVSLPCDDLLLCSIGKVMREMVPQVVDGYTTSTMRAAMPIQLPSLIVW